jgi:hypothetical protein
MKHVQAYLHETDSTGTGTVLSEEQMNTEWNNMKEAVGKPALRCRTGMDTSKSV